MQKTQKKNVYLKLYTRQNVNADSALTQIQYLHFHFKGPSGGKQLSLEVVLQVKDDVAWLFLINKVISGGKKEE